MTASAYEAYKRGRDDRRVNPSATTWEGILPYSASYLTYSWLDGWRDEAGDFHWMPDGNGPPIPVPWSVEGGRCPECSSYPLRRKKDGELWCLQYPCRRVLVRPNGRLIKEQS